MQFRDKANGFIKETFGQIYNNLNILILYNVIYK